METYSLVSNDGGHPRGLGLFLQHKRVPHLVGYRLAGQTPIRPVKTVVDKIFTHTVVMAWLATWPGRISAVLIRTDNYHHVVLKVSNIAKCNSTGYSPQKIMEYERPGLVMESPCFTSQSQVGQRENAKTNFSGESESRPSVLGIQYSKHYTELRSQTNTGSDILSDNHRWCIVEGNRGERHLS